MSIKEVWKAKNIEYSIDITIKKAIKETVAFEVHPENRPIYRLSLTKTNNTTQLNPNTYKAKYVMNKTLVYWYYGIPGSGKTYEIERFRKLNKFTIWTTHTDLRWFDGYKG